MKWHFCVLHGGCGHTHTLFPVHGMIYPELALGTVATLRTSSRTNFQNQQEDGSP
jgi:hypothetical protein